MNRKVTKAIFPVAGLGTRFLPATKSIPKEIMTLVDRPLIQYAIDEARAAGIKEFIFVTSRGKGALEDYFDHAHELENTLIRTKKTDLLNILRSTNMDSGEIAYVRQHKAMGLGHAVWCARRLISPDEPFAVVLTDDIITGEPPCLQQMVEAYQDTGGSMVATMEVAPDKAQAYGVLDVAEDHGNIVRARGMVEKPAPGTQPSNMAVIGRYILAPNILNHLNRMKEGAGGEIQLTDAIADEIAAGGDVFGLRFKGQRFDCGSKAGYLQATVAFGLARAELGPEFAAYLNDIVAMGLTGKDRA
ncbi:UTP--glucose-1-phosphate uridylyltransferase [Paracoccus sp. p4-l81]|uniref:UTP--glucose-1-phosphate uridylyltransferase n=1 Tax=unclassified Paracoccus (in: a-proteobacteria) TaxID=2688777 RepID=UPI0035B99D73